MPLFAVLLLADSAAVQNESDPADIEVQVEPLLQSLREAIAQERWLDAAQSFDAAWQQLHDGEDQTPRVRFAGTSTLRPGQHEPLAGARTQLRETYRSAPSAFREEYQRQYDGTARRQLREALQRGDRQTLLALVRRYEACKSSDALASYLVTDSMARGNLLNSAVMFRRLIDRTANPSSETQLLLADLWLRAGFENESQHTVRRLAERSGYGSTVHYRTREFRLPDSPDAIRRWLNDEFPPSIPGQRSTLLQLSGRALGSGSQEQQPARMSRTWQHSLFRSPLHSELSDRLERLERHAVMANGDAPISPTVPIVTNDLVIFQGIGSLQAVNRLSGDSVWESRLFNRQLQAALNWKGAPNQQSQATRTLDRIVRDAPRNHVRGQLTSDGRVVFCVEETSQGPKSLLAEAPSNVQVQNFNVLRVYDVTTGRLLGQAGGLASAAASGQTDPLAGTCFLGAPLLLQDRILILAEDSHGIHLLDLRLRAGSPAPDAEMRFEVVDRQLLSVPLVELPDHPLRRYGGMTPGFSDGLIICHGCDEQVLGLAADDLSIEWVHRYRANVRPKEIGGGDPVVGYATTDDDSMQHDTQLRPHDSFVRLAGSQVVLMPRDSDQIVCLNLHSGQEQWSRPRGELRYVAALTDSIIVLAGTARLVAARVTDGSVVWQQEFTEADISAQPAATDRLIYLPTRQGHVLVIDIATGRQLLDQRFSDSAIGNLLSVPGQLLAQSSTSVISWKPADTSIDPQLAALEESLLNPDPDEVIQRLVKLVDTGADETRATARQYLIEQLLESVRLDYRRSLHHIPLLKQMIRADSLTPVQIVEAIRAALALTVYDAAVFAEHWDAVRTAGSHEARLDRFIFQGLATQPDLTADEFVTQVSEIIQTALTRRQRLLQVGRVRLLSSNHTAATIQTALSRLDGPSQQRAVGLLRPIVRTSLDERADDPLHPDPVNFCWMAGLAECLLPLNESALKHLSAATQQALVPQLLASKTAGWQDARQAHQALNRFWNQTDSVSATAWPEMDVDQRGPGNDALGRIADTLRRERPESPQRKSPQVTVGDARTGKKRSLSSIDGAPKTRIPLHGTPGVYRGWQFVRLHGQPGILAIDDQGRRRCVFNPKGNNGIQIRPGSDTRQMTDYAVACGRLLALNDDGHLYMLNATEGSPQVLWSVNLDHVLPEATDHQKYPRAWQRTTVYEQQPDAFAPIGPLTEFGLPLFRGRRLVVLNPWTGQHMWTQDDLPDDCRMAASDDRLCLISESTSQIQVRSLRDGSLQQSGWLPDWWGEGNLLSDTSVRHIDLEAGVVYPWRIVVEGTRCLMFTLRPDQATLTSYDFAAVDSKGPAVAWQAHLPTNSVFSNVCEGLIATLSDNDQLQIRQVSGGTLVVNQTVPPIADCEHLYLRRSQDRILVLTYAPDPVTEPVIVSGAVPVNGPIYAIDARDGSVAWTENASGEYLRILNGGGSPVLPSAPLLILLSRKPRQTPGRFGADYATRIVDVSNGNVLYEDNNVGESLSYHALRFDDDGRFTVNFGQRAIEFDFLNGEPAP